MDEKTGDTKTKILDTARKLFADRGFDGVSVRDITGAAGVNISMISYYFGGKEGLYEEILQGEFASIMEVIGNADSTAPTSPKERIFSIADRIAELHTLHPELSKLLHHEVLHPTRMFSEKIVRGIFMLAETLRNLFEDGIREGTFRSDIDSFEMTYTMASMINYQFIFSALVSGIKENLHAPDLKIENLISILARGIEAK